MNLLPIIIKADIDGLTTNEAKKIEQAFLPTIESMNELGDRFNIIIESEITEDICKEAKELRQKFVKIRTTTAGIHKEEKAYYRKGGLYVDAWKNGHSSVSQEIESKLKGIEEYYINIERDRKTKLQAQRASILSKYMDIEIIPNNLGEMNADVWEMFSSGAEQKHKKLIREEKKAEKERLAAEAAEKATNERIRADNEKLRLENEKIRNEQLRINRKRDQEKARQDAIIKGEQEAREKLEREAREKEEAEKKAEVERLNAEEAARFVIETANRKAAAVPDKEKILAYLAQIDSVPVPDLNTSLGLEFMDRINTQMAEFHESIIEEVETCLS